MVNMKPKTAKAHVDSVDPAIIEADAFLAGLEFDMEKLREVRPSMADGSHEFENVANRLNTQFPFSHMLALNNDTHRNGLNIDTDS